MKAITHICWLLTALAVVCCSPSSSTILVPSAELIPVTSSNQVDSLSEATIDPYRQEMIKAMDVVIGHAEKRLVENEVESLLGNFVADAILAQSKLHYSGTIHMSLINNGGLRAPIPKGQVKISNIYELMPFENHLMILELNGAQTKALFEFLAKDKRIAVANTVVMVENNKPSRIFIDGVPFNEQQNYLIAVSDYLANGGGSMEFLMQAKRVEKVEVKIRDMIIDHIKWLESQGRPVDATIEGRVKLMP